MHVGMSGRRAAREKRSVECMIRIYCRNVHGMRAQNCIDCEDMLRYSLERLDRCKLMPDKPTCKRCPVHCYSPAMRHRIRAVMRYAGPRMFFRHPWLALCHVFDGFIRP